MGGTKMSENNFINNMDLLHLKIINGFMIKVFWGALFLSVFQDFLLYIGLGDIKLSLLLTNAIVLLALILPAEILYLRGNNEKLLSRYNTFAILVYIFFALWNYSFVPSNIIFVVFNVIITAIYYDKVSYILVFLLSVGEILFFSLYIPAYRPEGNIWPEISMRLQILFFVSLLSYVVFNTSKTLVTKLMNEVARQEQLEKNMARLDKLYLVGETAASIGHEIRNPLTTVRGFLQILTAKIECNKYMENFELMISELDRANSIIGEFLNLARDKRIELKLKNINVVVDAILPLMEAYACSVKVQMESNLGQTKDLLLDENEIRQLILNLARNGIDSMPSGGILTISTYMKNQQVVLSVRDQGTGIDPGLVSQLGTPFLTTKEKGTGLGLAICYSIARRHNANIEVETSSQGTEFFVRFRIQQFPA